ncbi:NAD(P)/FAD-dependent oxidoreductase [Nonomuraea roseoviolacea]|uniref:Glycine/D-amino acid oxidase-like deaminating enzyme n=1 Tax=Nonomuraea roseoviolacea subsp. carminata TaxID=160689 RepID=A0ABT1K5R2_9ACTN|nr:FAD-binding oxidoreductase [Nonomuraea roseoviolacea]MCP2349343.1 glycine/D-amino acid oxidase-like deaminating enzyme [Nonomuraea roseoviolacea subsp. carminata]
MSRVIVLGAGVLGASVAYHLAVAGAQVVVIEAGGPAAGTSSATFSMDVTHLKTPRAYYELNRASAALHATLAEELGGPSWRHPMPAIQWGDSEESRRGLRERAVRLMAWGHPCRIADPSELRELAPDVDPAACTADELVVHDQSAWYDAPLFVQRLLDRAAELGADIRYGLRAHALIRDGDAVTGVETGTRRWEADWVVNCTGPDADRVAALAGTDLPMTRIPGLVGESTPIPGLRLGAILATPEVDLRPAPGDRICSISWPVDALLAGQDDDALAGRLHAGGQRVLPALRAARLAGVRLGVRPVPADGLPLAGTHPGVPGLYHLVTHSGVNLAPELGRLAAQEIIGGDGPGLADYRVTRGVATSVKDESLTLMTTR